MIRAAKSATVVREDGAAGSEEPKLHSLVCCQDGCPLPPGRDAPNDAQKSFEPRNALYTMPPETPLGRKDHWRTLGCERAEFALDRVGRLAVQ